MSYEENSYIIEYVRNGTYMKVSAIDPATATEACVILPAQGLTQKQMSDLAIKRLKSVLNKQKDDA